MIEPLEQESIFTAIGLLPILRGKAKLGKGQLQRAANVPRDLRRRMATFLGSEAFEDAKDMPDFDYDETVKLVSAGQTPAMTDALFAAVLERELATDLGLIADRLQTWAKGIIPRPEPSGFQGLILEDPDPSSLGDFRRVWAVACDPMAALDDLEDGSLSEEQVAALQLLYPATYAEMRQAVTDVAGQLAARRGDGWQPSPTKAALIGVLRGEETVDLAIAADVQAMFAGEEAQEQAALKAQQSQARGGGGGAPPAPVEATPGQDAASGS